MDYAMGVTVIVVLVLTEVAWAIRRQRRRNGGLPDRAPAAGSLQANQRDAH